MLIGGFIILWAYLCAAQGYKDQTECGWFAALCWPEAVGRIVARRDR